MTTENIDTHGWLDKTRLEEKDLKLLAADNSKKTTASQTSTKTEADGI